MATIEKPITRLNLRRQLKLKLPHQQEKQHRGHLQLQLQLHLQLLAQLGRLRHSKHHQDSTSSVPQSNNYTHRNLRTHRQLTPPSLEHHNHNQNYSNAHEHGQRHLKYDDTSDEDSRKLAFDIKRRTSPPATDLPSPTATEIDEHDLDHEYTEEDYDGDKCQMSGSRSTATTETTTSQQQHQHQQQRSNTKIHRARSKSVSFVLPQELLTPKEEEDDEEEIMTRQKRRKLDSHKINCKEDNGKEEDLDNFSSDYPATPPESCSHEEEVEDEEEEEENDNDNDNEQNSKQLETPNEINHAESQIETNVQHDSTADKLAENTDYIALQSALGLVESQSKQIKQEMIQLSHLQKIFSHPRKHADEARSFITKLMNNEKTNLPKPMNIIKCPNVDWSKYKSYIARVYEAQEAPTLVQHQHQQQQHHHHHSQQQQLYIPAQSQTFTQINTLHAPAHATRGYNLRSSKGNSMYKKLKLFDQI